VKSLSAEQWAGLRTWVNARKTSLIAYVLVLAGLVTLTYVSTQYGLMYHEQRRLARQWQEQQKRVVPVSNTTTVSSATTSAAPASYLTRIVIPRINLDAIVVEGTNRQALMRGPGHLEKTAYPGEDGNVVITAHRDTFFRHIYELSKGDAIQVQRNGATYVYEVQSKKVVDPEDVAVAQPTKDARLTLITCYPTYYLGPAPERLVVISKLVSPAPQSTTGQASLNRAVNSQ
jgi:sortase A